jgi:ribonucleoside-diphosphate reductase beta chain
LHLPLLKASSSLVPSAPSSGSNSVGSYLASVVSLSNELISRDEGLHCDFACELNNRLLYPATTDRINDIIRDAVEIEHECVHDALPVKLLGLDADSMLCQYIEFCADRLLVALKQERLK